jgi:branched-chain amino acid transport system ATP-binding protein
MNSLSPLLEVRNLSVNYGGICALKNISLQAETGSITALVGANGAGKSTLMGTLIGLVKSTSGEVLFKSQNILGKAGHHIVRLGISLSPEGRQVFSDMTVRENLLLGAYSSKVKSSQQELQHKIDELTELFPILKERDKQLAGTLSGGEQQMLAIARALMNSPELLLLDEPSLGVSPLITEKIFEILVELNRQGMTILLAEQNAVMALEIAHQGHVLELGEVIYHAPAQELLANDVVQKAYLGL